MSAKVRPYGARLVVELIKEKERTAGGIIIPDSAKERPAEGIVVAVGEGAFVPEMQRHKAIRLAPGDRILFSKYAGTKAPRGILAEDHLLIHEDDVLGVIEGAARLEADSVDQADQYLDQYLAREGEVMQPDDNQRDPGEWSTGFPRGSIDPEERIP